MELYKLWSLKLTTAELHKVCNRRLYNSFNQIILTSNAGTLISRQRIRFPAPMDENFYDMIDLNVGREVEFYGKVFKITNCDKFTRNFLNRAGIAVPDPINDAKDPYLEGRSHIKDGMQPKKPSRSVHTLKKFLENDRKVLPLHILTELQF